MKYLSVLLLTVGFLVSSAKADYIYMYTSNSSNLLNSSGNSASVQNDSISLSFDSPYILAANSAYDFSIEPSVNQLSSWTVSDATLGLNFTGTSTSIYLASGNGLIEGGALSGCGAASCFGGTVITNSLGQIIAWNLVGDFATVSIISYNDRPVVSTGGLGSIDALSSNSPATFAENNLNGAVGSWVGPTSVPLPSAAWLFGSVLLGLTGLSRKPGVI